MTLLIFNAPIVRLFGPEETTKASQGIVCPSLWNTSPGLLFRLLLQPTAQHIAGISNGWVGTKDGGAKLQWRHVNQINRIKTTRRAGSQIENAIPRTSTVGLLCRQTTKTKKQCPLCFLFDYGITCAVLKKKMQTQIEWLIINVIYEANNEATFLKWKIISANAF